MQSAVKKIWAARTEPRWEYIIEFAPDLSNALAHSIYVDPSTLLDELVKIFSDEWKSLQYDPDGERLSEESDYEIGSDDDDDVSYAYASDGSYAYASDGSDGSYAYASDGSDGSYDYASDDDVGKIWNSPNKPNFTSIVHHHPGLTTRLTKSIGHTDPMDDIASVLLSHWVLFQKNPYIAPSAPSGLVHDIWYAGGRPDFQDIVENMPHVTDLLAASIGHSGTKDKKARIRLFGKYYENMRSQSTLRTKKEEEDFLTFSKRYWDMEEKDEVEEKKKKKKKKKKKTKKKKENLEETRVVNPRALWNHIKNKYNTGCNIGQQYDPFDSGLLALLEESKACRVVIWNERKCLANGPDAHKWIPSENKETTSVLFVTFPVLPEPDTHHKHTVSDLIEELHRERQNDGQHYKECDTLTGVENGDLMTRTKFIFQDEVAVIHINRIESDRTKINDSLDIWDQHSNKLAKVGDRYLVGAISHLGEDNAGHYVAYVCGNGHKWWFCDDSSVTPAGKFWKKRQFQQTVIALVYRSDSNAFLLPRGKPSGIKNIGSTCHFAAALQVLENTSHLMRSITQRVSDDLEKKEKEEEEAERKVKAKRSAARTRKKQKQKKKKRKVK